MTADVQRMFADSLAAPRVVAGPFRGCRCLPDDGGEGWLERSLGGVELELHGVWERVCAARPDVVVTLGDESGYTTVGLAARLPGARVAAFALTEAGHRAQRDLVRLNEMDGVAGRVSLHRGPEAPLLDGVLRTAVRGAAVFCDDAAVFAEAMGALRASAFEGAWVVTRGDGAPHWGGALEASHTVERVRGFAPGAGEVPEPWCEVEAVEAGARGVASAEVAGWRVLVPAAGLEGARV